MHGLVDRWGPVAWPLASVLAVVVAVTGTVPLHLPFAFMLALLVAATLLVVLGAAWLASHAPTHRALRAPGRVVIVTAALVAAQAVGLLVPRALWTVQRFDWNDSLPAWYFEAGPALAGIIPLFTFMASFWMGLAILVAVVARPTRLDIWATTMGVIGVWLFLAGWILFRRDWTLDDMFDFVIPVAASLVVLSVLTFAAREVLRRWPKKPASEAELDS